VTWVAIDDGFVEHRKVDGLSDRSFRLHIAALCYCGRNLTDGVLTERAVKVVRAIVSGSPRHVRELAAVGLWLDTDDGYQVKDYLEYNPSAEQVIERREKAKERMRRSRERASEHAGEVRKPPPLPSPKSLKPKAFRGEAA
jgi:hypothetical protein